MINIAPYWARARHGDFHGLGWSFTSEAEARANAERKAAQNAEWFALGTLGEHADWYYSDRPMREPILREFTGEDGALLAVVSRNSYGCLVLNTSGACFVDVDFPPPPRQRRGLLDWLLRKPLPAVPAEGEHEAAILARVEAWVQDHPLWGWRAYRTCAGVRLLATHTTMEPTAPEMAAVCQALGADVLYERLCKTQQCFRARLTPKSWRCGMKPCEVSWPCVSQDEIARMQRWNEAYQPLCDRYATCRYLRQIGASEVVPELQQIIGFHDEMTLAHSTLPLA